MVDVIETLVKPTYRGILTWINLQNYVKQDDLADLGYAKSEDISSTYLTKAEIENMTEQDIEDLVNAAYNEVFGT